jgi:hypothetical protein
VEVVVAGVHGGRPRRVPIPPEKFLHFVLDLETYFAIFTLVASSLLLEPIPCPRGEVVYVDAVPAAAAAVVLHGVPHPSPPVAPVFQLGDRMAMAVRAALERIALPLCRAAAAFVRRRAWRTHGFARLEDHARERFGRSGRWVRDLAALGEALQSMPRLAAALTGDDGGRPLGCVAALVIARVASPASLDAWIARARSSTVRALRESAARARTDASVRPPPDAPVDAASAPPAAGDARETVDLADRDLVRLLVPPSVAEAFDETLELFRAVEGHETTVTSFIEALVAEAAAGDGLPPDADATPLRPAPGPALRERALAIATDAWEHLPAAGRSPWAPARRALARLQELSGVAGTGGDPELDRQIRSLLELEDGLQVELGRLLAEMGEQGAWPRLMFAGAGHYAEERLRMSRCAAEDRVRAARSLRSYPLLRSAYEQGRLGLESVLTVLRILGPGPVAPGLERSWLARAEEATIKRLRDDRRALGRRRCCNRRGSGAGGGAEPGTSPGPREGPGLGGGTSRPCGTARSAGGGPFPPSDEEWHASLSRPPGRTRTRVLRFGLEAAIDAGAELPAPLGAGVPVAGPDVFLRFRLPRDLAADFLGAIEWRRRAIASLAAEAPPDGPRPDPVALPSVLAARTFSIRSRRVPAWTGLLSLLEDFVLCWDRPARAAGATCTRSPGAGAPPPRGPDAIYIRDGWRCAAPGCTSRRNLEDHHLRYRSRGGGDAPENRACLCRFHHQCGEHGGLASCRGMAPLGVTWRLGRPEVAAWYRNERRLAADRATRSG